MLRSTRSTTSASPTSVPCSATDVSTEELERLIERITTRSERGIQLERDANADDETTTDVRDLANQPPVVRYVNLLVRDAHDAGASDIHLEAVRDGLSARFRVDGVLIPALEPPGDLHHAIVSRIKLLAELDIAERRRPQDGRIRVRLESRELDLRVSTVPTMFGESVVLRLLDRGGRPVGLAELGMPAERAARLSSGSLRGRTGCCSSRDRPAAARRRRSTPASRSATARARRS